MKEQKQSPSLGQIVKSIFAAAIGVQNERARQRDFTYGNPAAYIVGGIVFTIVFVIALVVIVNLVLKSAGA